MPNGLTGCVKLFSGDGSSGFGGVPAVLWKDPVFLGLLRGFCNRAFGSLGPPSAWLTSGIIPVPKKGDLTLVH